MFQVGDRVVKRHYVGEASLPYSKEGTVVAVHGRWINVQHDRISGRLRSSDIGARFDYLAEDLDHINPLLKLASRL